MKRLAAWGSVLLSVALFCVALIFTILYVHHYEASSCTALRIVSTTKLTNQALHQAFVQWYAGTCK